MKIVILGAGRRGIRLAQHLVEEQKDVIILDENQTEATKAMSSVDCLSVVCNGTDINQLRDAGIEDSDAFIALTDSDETNLVSCGIVSSNFKIPITIAAVRNLSYTETEDFMGIKYIVNPYQEVAKHLAQDIERGIYSDIINFEDSSLVLYNVLVEKGSKYAGKLVKNLRKTIPGDFVISAINRNNKAFVPDGDTEIKPGDTLSLAARENSVEGILSTVGKKRNKTKKIAVVGATKVTDFLLHFFPEKTRKNVTVIAKDSDACSTIAQKYPGTLVINENIVNPGIFSRENLDKYDLFLAITDNDELNIITASYAKHIGTDNAVALVNKNPDYLQIADHLEIDSLASVQDITVDSIMRYIHGSNIASTHSLFNGQLEALEFKVEKDSPIANRKLMDINIKGKGIIAGITENGQTTIPNGYSIIKTGSTICLIFERKNLSFIQELLGIKAENNAL